MKVLFGRKKMIEDEYNLLQTTKEEASEITQFLISYHKIKLKDLDFKND